MPPSAALTERTVELPATAAAAGLARRELTAMPGISGEVGYKALLLVSELIGACLQEIEPGPDATIGLTIRADDRRVRVEVAGRCAGIGVDDALSSTSAPSLGGYGLRIVDRMADAWGTEQGPGGAVVWFELVRGQ